MLIRNAFAFINNAFCPSTSIRLKQGVIIEIGTGLQPAGNEKVLDADGRYVLPGFVDVHIHGCHGYDTMNGTADVQAMASALIREGVAAFLPTTMTASIDQTRYALSGIRDAMLIQKTDASVILGAHMEGPFLSPDKCGAQDPALLCPPSVDNFDACTRGMADIVRVLTLAPELPGAEELTSFLCKKGICVSAGHTNATAEQTHHFVSLGLTHVTHLFNAQPSLHHRQPGVAGAALTDAHICCEMICDGIHLHPDTVRLICAAKGPCGALAITDSMEAAGMPEGQYTLGGQQVTVREGQARLKDGTLAGSVLQMKTAFRNLLSWGIPPENAIQMCTSTPADSIGVTDFGRIRVGNRGCLTLWDSEWNMIDVVIPGE